MNINPTIRIISHAKSVKTYIWSSSHVSESAGVRLNISIENVNVSLYVELKELVSPIHKYNVAFGFDCNHARDDNILDARYFPVSYSDVMPNETIEPGAVEYAIRISRFSLLDILTKSYSANTDDVISKTVINREFGYDE